MIEKVKQERTEKVIKILHYSMEESNKQIMEIMKRHCTSGESKWTYISLQAM